MIEGFASKSGLWLRAGPIGSVKCCAPVLHAGINPRCTERRVEKLEMRGGARPAGGKASIWPALYRAISERSEIAARHSLSVSCGDHHVQNGASGGPHTG
jgi:hypothetical protein